MAVGCCQFESARALCVQRRRSDPARRRGSKAKCQLLHIQEFLLLASCAAKYLYGLWSILYNNAFLFVPAYRGWDARGCDQLRAQADLVWAGAIVFAYS